MLTVDISRIVTAFDRVTHGTKVIDRPSWTDELADAIEEYTFPENGQGFIPIPKAINFVSCGAALREGLTKDDFHVVENRGEIMLAAHRNKAAKATEVHAVVYTREAYLSDPQIDPDEVEDITGDYVLVAVIAAAGPSPVSSHRFVRNLAGGNARYDPANGYTIEMAIEEAKMTVEYSQKWVTVSDEHKVDQYEIAYQWANIFMHEDGKLRIMNLSDDDHGTIRDRLADAFVAGMDYKE